MLDFSHVLTLGPPIGILLCPPSHCTTCHCSTVSSYSSFIPPFLYYKYFLAFLIFIPLYYELLQRADLILPHMYTAKHFHVKRNVVTSATKVLKSGKSSEQTDCDGKWHLEWMCHVAMAARILKWNLVCWKYKKIMFKQAQQICRVAA